jgi:hypothetical protein
MLEDIDSKSDEDKRNLAIILILSMINDRIG